MDRDDTVSRLQTGHIYSKWDYCMGANLEVEEVGRFMSQPGAIPGSS